MVNAVRVITWQADILTRMLVKRGTTNDDRDNPILRDVDRMEKHCWGWFSC